MCIGNDVQRACAGHVGAVGLADTLRVFAIVVCAVCAAPGLHAHLCQTRGLALKRLLPCRSLGAIVRALSYGCVPRPLHWLLRVRVRHML